MLRLFKQVFLGLLSFNESLASIVNVSDHTKCISLNNQPCMTRSSIFNLNPDE